jgi:uncharacterized protein
MLIEELGNVDADLLEQLDVTSVKYFGGELELQHLAQLRRGSSVSYLVARDARGKPVGLAPVYTATPTWEGTVDPAVIFDPPVTVTPPKLCLAGSPGTYENHLTVAASLHGPEVRKIARALVEGARSLARDAGCPYVMLPYLDERQELWIEDLRAAATAVNVQHKAVLPVIWESFDDYVRWLPHGRRPDVRRSRRRFLQSEIDLREQPLVEVATDVAPLVAQTEKRYGRDIQPDRIASYFMLMGTLLDRDCFALVAYKDGRPAASSIIMTRGDCWLVRGWGCDYPALGAEELYFNLVYYEPIARGIERGAVVVDLGVSSLGPKRWRGCVTKQLHTILIAA